VLVFSIELGWLPVSGRGALRHLALPPVTLALGMSGVVVRLTPASLLGPPGEAWVRPPRAKAPPDRLVGVRPAFRAAAGPLVAIVGLQAGALLAGAVITETIFAWPGVGRLLVQAIDARDYPLVQGCVLAIGLAYVVLNAATDVVHGVLDPRLRDVA